MHAAAQLDADSIKGLSKAEMQEFYGRFFNPESKERARISVHMHAQKAGQVDKQIIDLLVQSGYGDVPTEKRQSIELLKGHLHEERKLSREETESILCQAKELGLKQAASGAEPGEALRSARAVLDAIEIHDVRRFKADLLASAGARPVKDLSEYEDVDAKL